MLSLDSEDREAGCRLCYFFLFSIRESLFSSVLARLNLDMGSTLPRPCFAGMVAFGDGYEVS